MGTKSYSEETTRLHEEINRLKKEKGAVIMAHYYTNPEIQDVADFIGDSLALARIAQDVEENVIVMCGVHFMGETAKILCPDKRVLVPDPEAGCSLADSCKAEDFEKFIKLHPGHTVISYVNTTADVKALTDIVVTSGNALKIVNSLPDDEKIIFGPDRNLGEYINCLTGRNMVLWDGACHVHERFSLEKILELKRENPDAEILVHPECRKPIQTVADKVGSTAVLLQYARESKATRFIVATESGILHQMRLQCPEKEFIAAPPSDTCGCNECAYMKLNTLEKLRRCLAEMSPEVEVDATLAERARRPIVRMLQMSR
ncbi:MAG TPA: quinolinate synthase NadA [Porphyromonadaceae bacterium]|jgi:quinolinate synthase|uniref:Quinolinate synthase n=2 Tax=Paramuribaculum intestinale TaxID=2094151 RepID=A0A2V1IXD7_9BACT|nr:MULTISPECIES: quinolinate synthase NadA [Bacteroidales]MBJ2185676.1 quinolinate synthase NadA [Muribaculaceae bacterium]MCX4294580.1 quinolinate synthase NadA [Prevotella sp.]ROS92968.1 quinolinate synthase NadA [Muribaculaceae bacterium Isolate-043 (Harlan)]HAB41478.1 quinolinate synthase NadA [Porphyromonadaceae bacterium]PWB06898.1 quinolinate synthase NadA [Paramuribaculum intestinale]